MGTPKRRRDGRLIDEASDLLVDHAVVWLKLLHEASGEALPGTGEGRDRRRRVGDLATDLAEQGLAVWRGLLDLQRRYDGPLGQALGGGRFGVAPGEELATAVGVLRFTYKQGEPTTATLTLDNRSRTWTDVVLPRAVELSHAVQGDRVWVELNGRPAAPVLAPGDHLEVALELQVRPEELVRRGRYLGRLRVDTRGPFSLELPMQLTVADGGA